MTVNDLIVAALRRLRVISGADPPSGDDLQDALLRFQDWLDDLRNQDFLDLWETNTTWPLVPGKARYEFPGEMTVPLNEGPLQAFVNATDIHNIGYIDATGNQVLLGPPLTDDAWAIIPNKTQAARQPSYFYMRGGPGVVKAGYTAFLYPWPIPNVAGLSGIVYYAQPVSSMTLATTLETAANLPPSWRRFLRDGLALELAPEFHVTDPAVLGPLQKSSDESKANIKRKQRRLYDLATPEHFGFAGGGNIYTGS
jgi:hypothetical protein